MPTATMKTIRAALTESPVLGHGLAGNSGGS
jgi:hypothetical protein